MTTIQIILAIIISLLLIVYVVFVIRYCVYYFKYGRYLDNEESNILSVEEEMKYRKKPVVIEAVQWNGENELELKKFVGDDLIIDLIREPQITDQGFIPKWVELKIKTLEGDMTANIGDYIIKGVNGEFYPCKPDIFEKTYERVEENE